MKYEDDKVIVSQYKVQLQIENQKSVFWSFSVLGNFLIGASGQVPFSSHGMVQSWCSGSHAVEQEHYV